MSSISAYTLSVMRGEYCMSKAAIAMLTKLLAFALADYGINVYEIRPGNILSDMTLPVKEPFRQADRRRPASAAPLGDRRGLRESRVRDLQGLPALHDRLRHRRRRRLPHEMDRLNIRRGARGADVPHTTALHAAHGAMKRRRKK